MRGFIVNEVASKMNKEGIAFASQQQLPNGWFMALKNAMGETFAYLKEESMTVQHGDQMSYRLDDEFVYI